MASSKKRKKRSTNKAKGSRNRLREEEHWISGLLAMGILILCLISVSLLIKQDRSASKSKTSRITQPAEHIKTHDLKATSKTAKPKQQEIVPLVKEKAIALKPTHAPAALIFVIDDMGHQRDYEELLVSLGDDVTYAILPQLEYSRYFAELSRTTGAEVILHQPLTAKNNKIDPGPGLIESRMSANRMVAQLKKNFESVPNAIGFNNHMGSAGTTDENLMTTLLRYVKKERMLYLDSYTTDDSIALKMAQKLKLPRLKRDVFLDNEDNQDYIRKQVYKAAKMAIDRGYAIAIGHYRYNTLKILQEEIPALKENGFQIISLKQAADRYQ